ncbi:hypothetical protein NAEGRDRAFT_59188 [Naegleria gruberi]|uniref:Zinc metalloproteinase n=1 Tax=Naegleria gruberi TaxID=5762 RepID=D2VTN9_NAEGR|nr:uncharacterized protein NAEGRDRAFT_59188 [Naegleria gruberi]EFC39686.1 hypothetical protein NAEGRDRAFT_59188 [Naegleria gruberi]|eukprot:XP_002672430.1 hypothetical protein NAEGRDRAFT_59188 [Naegleria gruberi strain NEG-M]
MTFISLSNHQDNSTYGYSLLRLCGAIKGHSKTNTSNGAQNQWLLITQQPANKTTRWEVRESSFKALILLSEGVNTLQLKLESNPNEILGNFTFTYDASLINNWNRENKMIKRVIPVHFVCSDHDGSFQSIEGCQTAEIARQKLGVAALMYQTFCAEALKHNKTFGLEMESDRTNMPHVMTFKSKKWTRSALEALGDHWNDGGCAGWSAIYEELEEHDMHNPNFIYFCVLAGSKYNTTTHKTQMGTALGGGKLALWTDCTLYSYAKNVDEIVKCLLDNRKVDVNKLPDDSCYRGSYWANYSTGLGAAMHELGHCFGCPHTPGGIMARGFDDFNRFFMISEPGDNQAIITKTHELGAFWEDSSIAIILKHPVVGSKSECVIIPGKSVVQVPVVKSNVSSVNTNSMMDCHYYVCGKSFENDSSFEHESKTTWLERHGEVPFASFIETARNQEEIILFDNGRNMELKLTKAQAFWKMADATNWYLLANGKPLFSHIQEDRKLLEKHGCEIKY